MTTYSPPISTRSTEELIGIKFGSTKYWQQEAIDQAEIELIVRGVTKEEEQKLINKWESEIAIEELKQQQRFEKNATEGYELIDKLKIFIGAPFILLNRSYSSGPNLWELKSQNYKLKFRQRAGLLIAGVVFWILLFYLSEKIS